MSKDIIEKMHEKRPYLLSENVNSFALGLIIGIGIHMVSEALGVPVIMRLFLVVMISEILPHPGSISYFRIALFCAQTPLN